VEYLAGIVQALPLSENTEAKDQCDPWGCRTQLWSTAIASKTVGAQVDSLLAKLPELQTKDQVDQFALDFCCEGSAESADSPSGFLLPDSSPSPFFFLPSSSKTAGLWVHRWTPFLPSSPSCKPKTKSTSLLWISAGLILRDVGHSFDQPVS
jgi:type II secretory pathway pseudopilin PulG